MSLLSAWSLNHLNTGHGIMYPKFGRHFHPVVFFFAPVLRSSWRWWQSWMNDVLVHQMRNYKKRRGIPETKNTFSPSCSWQKGDRPDNGNVEPPATSQKKSKVFLGWNWICDLELFTGAVWFETLMCFFLHAFVDKSVYPVQRCSCNGLDSCGWCLNSRLRECEFTYDWWVRHNWVLERMHVVEANQQLRDPHVLIETPSLRVDLHVFLHSDTFPISSSHSTFLSQVVWRTTQRMHGWLCVV